MARSRKLLVSLFVILFAFSLLTFTAFANTDENVAAKDPDLSKAEVIDFSDFDTAAHYIQNSELYENDEDFDDNYAAAMETINEFLDSYTEKKLEYTKVDPNSEEPPLGIEKFEEHSKIAMEIVREDIPFYATFWSLVPPLIAIVLALITKEVFSSLFVGIAVGALFSANFSATGAVDNLIGPGLIDAVSGTAGIFIFLVLLGVLVALLNRSGGSAAFGRWASKHIHSKVGASIATFILGVLIFIDDYFNCLTVGSIMRPVTDRNKVSRAKLAYLIDATAAPICMIAPISSWAAAVSSYAEKGQGLKLFIEAIPYNFYSLMTFVFIIALVLMKFDYGPMKAHELRAARDEFVAQNANNTVDEEIKENPKGRVIDLVLPIIILIGVCVTALVYVGNGNTFADMNFASAFADTDATVGLPWGALLALIVAMIYYIIRRVVKFKECMECLPAGFKAMVPAILILTMATALKNMTSMLGAKVFVAQLMDSAAGSLNAFLPAIIFVVACILAFATGTSWGTFGILIPIVTAMFPNPGDHTIMIIGMSACLAGAVCGDHCSPISDTTIMSSAGAQCDHLDHVSTQLPYAITVAAISFVGYIFAGFVQNAWISLAFTSVLVIGTLFIIKMLTKGKKA